jgi:hypothetical protein
MERKQRRLSFRVSYESPSGPGFHGRAGYLASWRPVYEGRGAIKINGSPFKTFDEAEAACDAKTPDERKLTR